MSALGFERLRWRLENAERSVINLRKTIAGYRDALAEDQLTIEQRVYVETVKGCAEYTLEAEMAKTRLIRVALGDASSPMPAGVH